MSPDWQRKQSPEGSRSCKSHCYWHIRPHTSGSLCFQPWSNCSSWYHKSRTENSIHSRKCWGNCLGRSHCWALKYCCRECSCRKRQPCNADRKDRCRQRKLAECPPPSQRSHWTADNSAGKSANRWRDRTRYWRSSNKQWHWHRLNNY